MYGPPWSGYPSPGMVVAGISVKAGGRHSYPQRSLGPLVTKTDQSCKLSMRCTFLNVLTC